MSLSPEEEGWLKKRQVNTAWAIRDFLARVNIGDFDSNAYIEDIKKNASALPNIGIAVSGGGYRALMHGAGIISAFDNRTQNSTQPGHVGGLLQATTYLSGLSGGSWLVGSLYIPKLRSVQEISRTDSNDTASLWQFENSIIEGQYNIIAFVPALRWIRPCDTLHNELLYQHHGRRTSEGSGWF